MKLCHIFMIEFVVPLFLQAMTMMGLYDFAYWSSWLIWETVVTIISALLIVLFGMMFQFSFFLKNSFAVLFVLFFLFELNMVSNLWYSSSLTVCTYLFIWICICMMCNMASLFYFRLAWLSCYLLSLRSHLRQQQWDSLYLLWAF